MKRITEILNVIGFELLIVLIFILGNFAHAGLIVEDVNKTYLGNVYKLGCGSNTTCTITGGKATMAITGGTAMANGIVPIGQSSSAFTTFPTWPVTTLTAGTSTTPSATTVYLAQIVIPFNVTLTGIAVNNAGTCGTNKYVVALFSAAGVPLANSATAGVLCSGTSAWQQIPFSSTLAVKGPGVYFVGLYMNGITDRFYTIPAAGAFMGLSGTVTGQTFGTVTSVAVPTTFTAGTGPVAYTY